MLNTILTENIIFIDIETIPQFDVMDSAPEATQKLWEKKARYLLKEDETPSSIYQRAGIYAEFGKIICISIGMFIKQNETKTFRIKSFYGDNEKALLEDFIHLLSTKFIDKKHLLCAHNGKEFDYPYIARRILINGLILPPHFDFAGKKPWEITHLDTMELWRFGDYKSYTSLELLATIFGIETPKDDIDGSQVADVYYKERNIERIVTYCQKDIITLAQLFIKMRGETPIDKENISYSA